MYSLLSSAEEREIVDISSETKKVDSIPSYTGINGSGFFVQFARNLEKTTIERNDYTVLMLIGDIGALFGTL